MEMKYKFIIYFFSIIIFFYNVNPSIKHSYESIFNTKMEYSELLWLIDIILLLLFYSFVKANPLVFTINIFIILFCILAFFNTYYILKGCDKTGKQLESFIVISLLFLGIFLYLNKEKTLGDCSLLAFSKMIILLSTILSLVYGLNDLFIFSLILFLYVNKIV